MKWLALVLLLSGTAHAQDAPPKTTLCSGCHGANGVPVSAAFPVIAGQNEGYLYLEMRDYKLGNRKNVVMQAVAAKLEKQDMKDLAAFYAGQTWPSLRQQKPSDDAVKRAQAVEGSAVCKSCHGDGYVGDSAIPRAAGQRIAYLKATMQAFRSGERANNPWMTSLLKTYSDEDIDALASYLGGM